MTDHEINVAVAKALGWRWMRGTYIGPSACPPAGRTRLMFTEKPDWIDWSFVPTDERGDESKAWTPDYASDLNAMHEAERYLTPNQALEYEEVLDNSFRPGHWSLGSPAWSWHATARQRAEAFLRSRGLWKEAA